MINYVLARALALYTGSPSLTRLVREMKHQNCSNEAFRYIRQAILECLVAEIDLPNLENNILLCVTKCGSFYEVKIWFFSFLFFIGKIFLIDFHKLSLPP